MDYKTEFSRWREALSGSEYTEALAAMADDEGLMKDAFAKHLEFGTAGMRGIMGPGTNRMNIYTVRRCSKGLADYILSVNGADRGVAIAYDSRINSARFAKEAALVLAAAGIKVYLYSTLHSVPQLSFTVRELKCAAGVAVTASHNPREYNGYKVYGEDGGQLFETAAEQVTEFINAVPDLFAVETASEDEALASGRLIYIGEDMDERYYERVLSLIADKEAIDAHGKDVTIVYTPLHGSGNVPVREVLRRMGLCRVHVVPEQELPDGSFPTVSVPNPEDPAAFALAKELADKVGADVIIGTDPDCDRLGLTLRDESGGFLTLNGNTIGCLFMDYILSHTDIRPGDFAVTTIVSTPLAGAIAESYGVTLYNVLTGFKNIADRIKQSEYEGGGRFLYGFEESHGYLTGSFVRDKDAVIAAMLAAQAACSCAAGGITLHDALREIEKKYGYFAEKVYSKTLTGLDGIAKISAAVDSLRGRQLKEICGRRVLRFRDYRSHICRDMITGQESVLDLPASNVLCYDMDGARLIIRPSGTEPKLKTYCSAFSPVKEEAETALAELLEYTQALVEELTK